MDYHYEITERDGRTRVGSGTPFEARVGYSRVVRIGAQVWVAGTTATGPDGTIVAPGDPYAQTHQALANIARALAQVGATLEQVVRLRIMSSATNTGWRWAGRWAKCSGPSARRTRWSGSPGW